METNKRPAKPGRFLLLTLVTMVVLLGGVYRFNRHYDFGHIFSAAGFYREMAGELKSGKFVYGIENCDLRSLKEAMIQELEVPETVAIGSSTVMELHASFAGGTPFFNAWVSGGNSQDIGAVAGAYLYHKGRLPRRFIVAVEPWYFEYKGGGEAWKSWQFYLYYLRSRMLAGDPSLRGRIHYWLNQIELIVSQANFLKLSEGMSYGVTRYNLAHLARGAVVEKYETLKNFKRHPTYLVYHPGGSISESLQRDQGKIIDKKLFNLPRWNKFSPKRFEEFRRLISFLQNQGSEVLFYLPPWHPQVYEKLVHDKKDILFPDVEKRVRRFAEVRSIPVVGSFDPANVAWDAAAFKDAHHAKESYLRKLFTAWNKKEEAVRIGRFGP